VQREFEPRFTLHELEDASGIPRRTIRLYVSRGLVPPALGRGRSSYYTRRHLEALAHISDYRSRGLSLDEIAEALGQGSPARLQSGEEWKRFELSDGIELHVHGEAMETQALLIQALLEVAARSAALTQ
jgi:DNA-binding transcriptional MerR regulator